MIVTVVVVVVALMGALILFLFLLDRKRDRLRAEKRRLQWMADFVARGVDRMPDVVGGTPHERAAVRRSPEGHRFADQFVPSPMRKGGINSGPRGPKPPPPPPGRVVRDSMFPSFAPLHEATDAPARRLRRRTP